jgi:hypothetical protein
MATLLARLMTLCFFGAGLALFCIGAYRGLQTAAILRAGARAEGQVLRNERQTWHGRMSRNGGRTEHVGYAPVVAFTTAAGKSVEFEGRDTQNPPRYAEGEKVAVIYDPADPSAAVIDDFADQWSEALVLGGFGLLVVVFMTLTTLAERRRARGLRAPR